MLSTTPSALANPTDAQTSDRNLPTLQADDNPIMDTLSCSCARCVMGQQADM